MAYYRGRGGIVRVRRRGGAEELPPFTLLTQVEQASNAIYDPSGLTDPGTEFDPTTGQFTIVSDPTDVTVNDGFNEVPAGWSVPILTLYPDFDPATDYLELMVSVDSMLADAIKCGFAAGVHDGALSAYATAPAALYTVFPNTSTNRNAGLMATTSTSSGTTQTDEVDRLHMICRWNQAANRQPMVRAQSRSRLGTWADVTGLGPAATAFTGALSGWRIRVQHVRFILTGGGRTVKFRVYHRRIRTTGTDLPATDRGALVTPPRIALLSGHSIAQGTVVDGTYGAATIDSRTTHPGSTRVRMWDATGTGATAALTTYPAGSAPGCSIAPYLLQAMVDAGQADPVLFRRAQNGITLQTWLNSYLPALVDDVCRAGFSASQVDLVVICIGENDAQAGESTAFAALLPVAIERVEAAFPRARVLIQEIITTDTGLYPEYAAVGAAEVATVALGQTRSLLENDGVALTDSVHPSVPGYAVLGPRAVTNYLAGS